MANLQIGDFEITRVEDFTDRGVPLKLLFPALKDETLAAHRHWLAPDFLNAQNDTIDVSIHSWVVRTRHHTVLVDSCVGHQKNRHFPPFHMRESRYLANLAAAGVDPAEIDFVFCTHLHSDHVGWNTRLDNGRWAPTFPKATYLFSRADYDAFDPRQENWPGYGGTDADTYFDSVLPVVEAGQVEFVAGEHEISDGLTIIPCPGHSPGHMALRVEDRGESGLFTGDSMHHPIQVAEPRLNSFSCWDADLARSSRRMLLEECCERHRLLVPGHFAAPHFGRVSAQGETFAFQPGAASKP
jgi:glyoxylase-like metal-dependent hydrolase (beta-lactamase superfamily II)